MVAVIFGANGGIGCALVDHLLEKSAVEHVIGVSRRDIALQHERFTSLKADMLDEASLGHSAEAIKSIGQPDLVIVATGFLSESGGIQPERSFKQQSLESFEQLFRINTFGPALIAKHMLPLLARDRRSVFACVSARVGSIGDNRLGGWHAYRASKAALNMLIRNYAIEIKPRYPQAICVGLHPGTVDTALSQPFQRRLPDGQLIAASDSARHLLGVLDALTPAESGSVYDWKGKRVPE